MFALDPRTKLLASMVLIAATFLLDTPLGFLLLSMLFALVMRVNRIPFRVYGRNLLMISWLLAATFLTHTWQSSALNSGFRGVMESGLPSGKLCIVLGWATILGRAASPLELVSAIERLCVPLRRLGVPVQRFSIVAMLSMRFLPLLFEEGQYLLHASLARGFEWNHGTLKVRLEHLGAFFLPLFSQLLRRVDHLTFAMENKAFRLDEERTSLYVLCMGPVDYGMLCACLAVLFCGYML